MNKKNLVVNNSICLGCHTCEMACAIEHTSSKDLYHLARVGERPGYRIFVEQYAQQAVPVHCNHCEEAACLLACPTGAVYRKEERGPVLVDSSRCIGCLMCVQACPFGVMTLRMDGKNVLKCDLCYGRLQKGLEPACVTSCPTKAIALQTEQELTSAKRRQTAERIVLAKEAA